MKKTSILFLLFVLCSCGPKYLYFSRSKLMMGHVPVTLTMKLQKNQSSQALRASEQAYALASQLEMKISEYQPSSEVSCLNKEAGKNYCLLSAETLSLLKEAEEISKKTSHAFDIRFASKTIQASQKPILFQENLAKLQDKDTQIGVGAIGKGFIVDAMATYLISQGFQNFLINAGDLRAVGGPWKVDIQSPSGNLEDHPNHLVLFNQSLASSGNYEQPGHIKDPKNSKSVIRQESVSVMSERLTLADALSTAMYVLGPEKIDETLKQFNDPIEVRWIKTDGSQEIFSNRKK